MDKILVVDDEAVILRILDASFRSQGYDVVTHTRGDTVLRVVEEERPSLVVLDVGLPGLDGFTVCRELRYHGYDVPIIMLTVRSDEIDTIGGLDLGADDYVTKPFSERALLARVRACLRRSDRFECLTGYSFDGVHVDFRRRTVTRDGDHVRLKRKEYDTLCFLIRHRGKTVTREQLLHHVWGYDHYPNTRTVDTHILELRGKLERHPAAPEHILAVHGEGYCFV